ncbi:50S ribosomal protein L11 methyltransferase [Dethiosulfatarculus sandiegensis]|uniref:Ribosomal protein L11 methyltransferase n=1 Tax=Dethiosulfatarculus sandiegensis TaxID=1429043 RepID=A0A0D2JCN2_9BACT|nr:50S ribosomal protein L11 methyltransferase [Dethiosulfatarculus sandiegensis]KIX13501.1 hypothetical protein X474_13530 [Dethiosulfatarculus sandiegensis]
MAAEQTQWLEVAITAAPPQAEAAADFLANLTGRGVLLKDGQIPENQIQVLGYLDADHKLDEKRARLERFTQSLGQMEEGETASINFNFIPAEDWSRNWKKHFHPREAIPGLIIAPSWEVPEPEPGKNVVIIDPGQAFGTGHHESTLLCMKRISRLAKRDLLPERVLDVGCGTGILSFTALAFGAQSAVGVDLDPEAIKAARKNAEINNMADKVEFSETPLASLSGKFPLVMANLTAKDVTGLAQDLADHLAPGGELVVSGILPEQAGQVRKILEQAGLTFMELNTMAAWSSLVMA